MLGGKLMTIIGDEDTVTGFLMGGIGELNKERHPNFLVSQLLLFSRLFFDLKSNCLSVEKPVTCWTQTVYLKEILLVQVR